MKPSEIFETPEASGFDRVNTHQQPSSKQPQKINIAVLAEDLHSRISLHSSAPAVRNEIEGVLESLLTSHSEAIRERVKAMKEEIPSTFEQPFELAESVGRKMALDDILALLTDNN